MKELIHINLNTNEFSKTIPQSINELSKLNFLGLFVNQLTGPFFTDMSGLVALTKLQIMETFITGKGIVCYLKFKFCYADILMCRIIT